VDCHGIDVEGEEGRLTPVIGGGSGAVEAVC
jgi:hypothetical protein